MPATGPLQIHYFFCLFKKYVKTLQDLLKQAVFHLFIECMDGLFHKITEKHLIFQTDTKLGCSF